MDENFLQPTLIGNTISLRPLAATDFEALYTAASDPLIWAGHPAKNRYCKDVFERWFQDAMKSVGSLVIEDRHSDQVIGSSRYYEFNASASDVAIGFTFIKRSFWGGATNRELKELMLRHAFSRVATVWFHVDTTNIRSQKAMAKIGGIQSHIAAKQFSGSTSTYVFFKIERKGG